MPVASTTIARDEMFSRLKVALDASSVTSDITITWEGAPGQPPQDGDANQPPPDSAWMRIGLRHGPAAQTSLGGATNGRRRQTITGLVFVQVFTPVGDGYDQLDQVVDVVLNAYRTGPATPSGIQFKQARRVEAGKSGSWDQTNCLIAFEYDMYVGP